jgi:aldehyde dehydrogenase (NAD+)
VLAVIAHDGDDDAVRIANDSPYGLSGRVFSGDEQRAHGIAARMRVGSVNGGVWYTANMPFGGCKQSGTGREMGLAGFEECLETKAIATAAN